VKFLKVVLSQPVMRFFNKYNNCCSSQHLDHLELNVNGPVITKDLNFTGTDNSLTKQFSFLNFYTIGLKEFLFDERYQRQLFYSSV